MDKAKIKLLMKRAGVRQKDIAADVGVTPQFVNQVICGRRSTFSIVSAIAKAVNKPISDLWPDQDQA